jgi:hypothetical protein
MKLDHCHREACKQTIEALQRELANEKARDIHSCHNDCTRNGCVNRRLRERIEELTKKNQNLFNALMESTAQKDNLYKSIKSAIGHMNLYGLFSCVEGDSYDPECADLNARKALSILKSELTTDIIKPAGKEDQAVYDSITRNYYK